MSAISRAVADKLFDVCNWAHETWILHRTLFDDNPDLQELGQGHHVYFLNHLNHVLQEYALLQMAKLHDPAVMSGRVNLSLAYILDYGGWDVATAGRLRALKIGSTTLIARFDRLATGYCRTTILSPCWMTSRSAGSRRMPTLSTSERFTSS